MPTYYSENVHTANIQGKAKGEWVMAQHVDTTPKKEVFVQPTPTATERCPACFSVMWQHGCKQRCTNRRCNYTQS